MLRKFADHARQWLCRPSIIFWAAAAGVTLALPSLWIGLQADDHYIRLIATEHPIVSDIGVSRSNIFTFADGVPEHNQTRMDRGLLPWWAHPTVSTSFLRPISGLLHVVDYTLFTPRWWLMHVHNLIWYAALCIAVGVLYRRFGLMPWVAGVATLLYAIDDAHGMPAGWMAGRNAVLTSLFSVIALNCHITWRQRQKPIALVLALCSFAVGLVCGEAALAATGYLFAYAVCLDTAPWRSRILSLVPYATVSVAYLAIYVLQGFGAHHTGMYDDPFGDPAAFLISLPMHFPVLAQGQLGIITANAAMVFPGNLQFAVTAVNTVVLLLLLVVLFPLLRSSRTARFSALGMGIALLPLCTTIPSDRILVLAGVGGSALVAEFIQFAASRWTSLARSPRRTVERIGVVFFVITHAIAAPISLPFASTSISIFGTIVETGLAAIPADDTVRDRSIIVVNAPFDVYTVSFACIRAGRNEPIPNHLWALNAGFEAMTLRRIDASILQVDVPAGFFTYPYATTFHHPRDAWRVNDFVTTTDFTATILEVTSEGAPSRIQYAFNRNLDDPTYAWYYLGAANLEPFPMLKPGESFTIEKKSIAHSIRQMFKLISSKRTSRSL